MHLACARKRINHPNPAHAEGEVFAHFLHGRDGGVFRGKNFYTQPGRLSNDPAARCAFRPVGQDTDIRDAKAVGADLDALLRYGEETETAANGPQFFDKKALYTGMFPGWRGTSEDSPFHKLGIVVEAHVKVLLGTGKFSHHIRGKAAEARLVVPEFRFDIGHGLKPPRFIVEIAFQTLQSNTEDVPVVNA